MWSHLSIPPTKRFSQNLIILHKTLFAILCYSAPNSVKSTCDLIQYKSLSSCMHLVSRPHFTASTSPFGQYIEGTSTDRKGNMFAVNYGNSTTLNTIGQFNPTTRLFYTDPVIHSKMHGMRFLNEGVAYVVDAVNHRVLQLKVASQKKSPAGNHPVVVASSIYCGNPRMLEPNDLTLSKSGTVFTSGMSPLSSTDPGVGHVWSCTQNGKMRLLDVMGRTNGIDLSPDDRLLYVSEFFTAGGIPVTEKIWVYDVQAEEGRTSGKRLFADFATFDSKSRIIDGMRTDVAGNLWVTRNGGGEVVVLNQCGKLIARMAVSFTNPTNLEFGGENGTTLFIVGKCDGADAGCIDSLKVVNTGRSWTNLQ